MGVCGPLSLWSFCKPSLFQCRDPPGPWNRTTAVQANSHFRPLGAPGLDFSRFWAILFSTSILGSIFNGFLMDFGSIFDSILELFSMISASLFRARFLDRFSKKFHDFFNLRFFEDVRFTYEKPMIFNIQPMIFKFFSVSNLSFFSMIFDIIFHWFFMIFHVFPRVDFWIDFW